MAHTSESSEEFLEEEVEHRASGLEDESSEKDARPVPEAQPRPEKQDAEKVWARGLSAVRAN